MIEAGATVSVIIPFPTDSYTSIRRAEAGSQDGILYEYTSGLCKSKYKMFRALSIYSGYRKAAGFLTSFITLYKRNKRDRIDTIIVSSDGLRILLFYSIVSKLLGAKMVFIFDEYPIPIRHKLKNAIPFWKSTMYRLILKNIDAYVSISDSLQRYFCGLCNKKSFILSSITDTTRFPKIDDSSLSIDNYFCYMGNMELSKDNVDLIIRAYAGLSPDIQKRYKLYLYGVPSQANKQKIMSLIESLSLDNSVLFKGSVAFDQVPSILKNAAVLLSSQPDTLRAQGGFPTKLGEYLLSGTPTLMTDVGENSKFVRGGSEVYFAKPNSIEDYTQKLEHIINNYCEALRVASQGKRYVEESFSHTKQGARLLNFLQSL